MKRFYVYYLVDPRNRQPFYVGKGSGDRIKCHEQEAAKDVTKQWNRDKCQIINDILSINLNIEYVIVQKDLSESSALILEREQIKKYGLKKNGGILTNISVGGIDGSRRRKRSVDQYDLTGSFIKSYNSIQEAAFENHMRPSQVNGVLKHRTLQAGNFLWAYKGHNPRPFHARAKRVIQKDKNDNLIKIWSSVRCAVEGLDLPHSSLRECISGKHHTCGGWKWNYE